MMLGFTICKIACKENVLSSAEQDSWTWNKTRKSFTVKGYGLEFRTCPCAQASSVWQLDYCVQGCRSCSDEPQHESTLAAVKDSELLDRTGLQFRV